MGLGQPHSYPFTVPLPHLLLYLLLFTFFLSCFYVYFLAFPSLPFLPESPNLSGRPQIGCLPYFYTWCGPSANLECRSKMCCTRLAANAGPKNVVKNRHLGTIAQLRRAISSQLRHVWTIRKKLVKQQYHLHMSSQYGELGPLAAEIVLLVYPGNFNGFRVLAALLHCTLVVGLQPNFAALSRGATYIRQGGHHVGHWPTFLVS